LLRIQKVHQALAELIAVGSNLPDNVSLLGCRIGFEIIGNLGTGLRQKFLQSCFLIALEASLTLVVAKPVLRTGTPRI